MRIKPFFAALAMAGLAACANKTPAEPAQAQAQAPGSDRDAHGCIASAGYSWCARNDRCERPWELAKAASFENTKQAFDAYCKNPTASTNGG